MKQLLVPILLVVNLAATSTVLVLAMTGKLVAAVPMAVEGQAEAPVEEMKQVFYHELKPELVVNFPGGGAARYMQLSLTAVTPDEDSVALLERHEPAIRNDLLMLFSGLEAEPLAGREGKENMRKMALEAVREIMKKRTGREVVDDLYFTRFVMQ